MAKRPIAFFDLSGVVSLADEAQRRAVADLIAGQMVEELNAQQRDPEHRPKVWRVEPGVR